MTTLGPALWEILYRVNGREVQTTVEALYCEVVGGALVFRDSNLIIVRAFAAGVWVDTIKLARDEEELDVHKISLHRE